VSKEPDLVPGQDALDKMDYDFVDIEGTQYVLPMHAEVHSCWKRAGLLSQ